MATPTPVRRRFHRQPRRLRVVGVAGNVWQLSVDGSFQRQLATKKGRDACRALRGFCNAGQWDEGRRRWRRGREHA